jgi:DNA polymerase-1
MALADYKDLCEYPIEKIGQSNLPCSLDTETLGTTKEMNIPFYFSWAANDLGSGAGPVHTPEGYAFLCELVHSGRPLIFHNAKFDISALEHLGLYVNENRFHDTTLMLMLCYEHDFNSFALKPNAARYLNHKRVEAPEIKKFFKNDQPNNNLPQHILHPYAQWDAEDTLGMYEYCLEWMQKQSTNDELWNIYKNVELPAVICYKEIDQRGVCCDIENVQKTHDTNVEMLAPLLEELQRVFEEPSLNPRSPQQLSRTLSKHFRLTKTTKTGFSTGKEVLEELNYDDRIKTLLAYKAFEKSRATLAGYMKLERNGRLYPDYRQTTTTGRSACEKPNLMNIPKQRGRISELEIGNKELAEKCAQAFKQVRATFKASPGALFFGPDYKQAEYRAFAHYSGSQRLIDALIAGEDFHKMVCRMVFGTYDERQRHIIKIVNYGLIYGMGDELLKQHIKKDCDEPAEVLKRYERMLPEMRYTQHAIKDTAKRRGYVQDVFGRHYRYLVERPHAIVSWLCQGTVANIKKIALNRTRNVLRNEGARSGIVMDIHDQLVFDMYPEDAKLVYEIKRQMEDFDGFSGIPIITDTACGPDLLQQSDLSIDEVYENITAGKMIHENIKH